MNEQQNIEFKLLWSDSVLKRHVLLPILLEAAYT
jgi:hypothetical protein